MSALVAPGTFSKDPALWGLPPDTCIDSARQPYRSYVPINGEGYLDWVSGLGANLLGYNHTGFYWHVTRQLVKGSGFSLTHSLEHKVADLLANQVGSRIPGWQGQPLGVRFCKTGTDATTMAVRLARAVTGNGWVITFDGHYHGWADWSIARTSPGWGLPHGNDEATRLDWAGVGVANWQDKGFFLKDRPENVDFAAVIFEQPATDPVPGWYIFLRRWCDEHNALLIADEVVTGLRYGVGGACERYGIEPDLVCYGKALGNGLPVAALMGRREHMNWFSRVDPVFCSSTGWGETIGLAAAEYVLTTWNEASTGHLWAIGNLLIDGLTAAGWDVFGHGARSVLKFASEYERAWFIQGMYRQKVLMNRPNLPNLGHFAGDVRVTAIAAEAVRQEYEDAGEERVKEAMRAHLPRVLFEGR